MNQMEVSFSAILDNENFARTTVAAFLTPLNPTIDEIIEFKTMLLFMVIIKIQNVLWL